MVDFTAKFLNDGVTDVLTSMTDAMTNAAIYNMIPGVVIDPNSIQNYSKLLFSVHIRLHSKIKYV